MKIMCVMLMNAFKHQSLKKRIQLSPLVRAGNWTTVFVRIETRGLMFTTCSPQLEHDQGFYQGLNLHVVKRFWLGNHLARFPSLEITCYVCQFAGTREMTMDSPSMLAGPGALPACSPVLGLREGSHGQEISYISEYWVKR